MKTRPFNLSRSFSGTASAGCLLLLSVLTVGCSGPSMQPGDLSRIQATSDRPRAGNVYLLRGFIGIWSTGIDALGARSMSTVRANVYRCEQWREVTDAIIAKYQGLKVAEPLVIIGHSWGADHAIDLARAWKRLTFRST